MGCRYIPANNLSCIQIHICCQIHISPVVPYIGEIRDPYHSFSQWTYPFRVVLVWCRLSPLISSFSPPGFSLVWLEVKDIHRSSYSLSSCPECHGNPSVPVCWVCCKNALYLFFQLCISLWLLRVVVDSRPGNMQNLSERLYFQSNIGINMLEDTAN